MKRTIFLITAIVLITLAGYAIATAQEPVAHDWGQVRLGPEIMQVDVREMLTQTKSGWSGNFALEYAKAIKLANPQSKKMLQMIWAVPGVSGMNFRSYQMQISKGPLFVWPEIEPGIYSAMDTWHTEVTKQPPEPKE